MQNNNKKGWKYLKAITKPDKMVELLSQEGEIASFKFLGPRMHIIGIPGHIKYIFQQNPNNYVRPKLGFENIQDILGQYGMFGLLTKEERPIWKKHREVFQELLKRDYLQQYATIMVNTIRDHIQPWELVAETGTPINIGEAFANLTLKNLMATLFSGAKIDITPIPHLTRELFNLGSPLYYPYYVKLFDIIPLPLYLKYKKYKKQLSIIADDIIKQCFDPNVPLYNLVKHLANAYGYTSDHELSQDVKQFLKDETKTFLIAGHETTAGLLVHTFVYFSLYPLVMQKVSEEIKTVLGDRDPTFADLPHLSYTNAVLKEVLRFWPPGLSVTRISLNDDMIAGTYSVKKNDLVIIPSVVSRSANYWHNPEGFEPARFLQPLTDEQRWSYMPFGLGERNCVGAQFALMQATLALVIILRKFRLHLTPGSELKRDLGVVNRLNPNVTMNVYKKELYNESIG